MNNERSGRRRKFWGLGYEGDGYTPAETEELGQSLSSVLGLANLRMKSPPRIEDIDLRPARVSPPDHLGVAFSQERHDRASHSYGKSERDLARAFVGDYPNPIDLVAYPRTDDDIAHILDWAAKSGIAVIPYGGGASVVGGVEPNVGDSYIGVISLDLA